MPPVQLIGRRSSHFTRVAAIFAHELEVPFELIPVFDITSVEPSVYLGNPALKIPTLRTGGSVIWGTENICRKLTAIAAGNVCVVWPEQVESDLARNAQELVWHGMAAQVQLVFGTKIARLPPENVYFAKGRDGLKGALAWLEERLPLVLHALPGPRQLSLFEVTLFCLVEHLAFRRSVSLAPYPALVKFAAEFGARPSARSTQYFFDVSLEDRKGDPMTLRLPALDPSTLPVRNSSTYPEQFRARVVPREKRAVGDALGLTKLGVNLTTLFPGKESALRHHHLLEDELVFVLEGEVRLRTDEGEQVLTAGTCAGFRAGSGNGHQLVNRSDRPARYLELSNRDPSDTAEYPDEDLKYFRGPDGKPRFTRKDGSSY